MIPGGLAELVAAEWEAAEAARSLTPPVMDALVEQGWMRSLVPAAYGGGEMHPAEFQAGVEELATVDGAAGWIVAVGATAGLAVAYLPAEEAGLLAADPATVHAGAFAPRGRLDPTGDDTLRLSGRWPLCSGVEHADWVGLGCMAEGAPVYALVPRGQVEVIDTWDSLGLRATGSHDVAVDGLPVPASRVVRLIGGAPRESGPLYRFPLFGLLAIAIAGVCTGIARGALDAAIASAAARRPAGSGRSMAERATTQERVAASEASLRAARALVASAIEDAWSRAEAGQELGTGERLGLRLAATNAARTAVAVVDTAHALGGSGSLYRGNDLERRLRDVHTVAQHMLVSPATLELEGRLLLGLDTDVAQL